MSTDSTQVRVQTVGESYPEPDEPQGTCSYLVFQITFNPSMPTSVHCADLTCYWSAAGISQSVYRLATSWTVQCSKPGGGEIFRPVQAGTGAYPTSYSMGTESLTETKRQRRGVDHPPRPSEDDEERVEYTSTPRLSLHGLLQGKVHFAMLPASVHSRSRMHLRVP